MRYGTPVKFVIDYTTLDPVVAPADPPTPPDVRIHTPTSVVDVDPGDIQHVATGVYRYDHPALLASGQWRFVARADGFPEIRLDADVEPSAW